MGGEVTATTHFGHAEIAGRFEPLLAGHYRALLITSKLTAVSGVSGVDGRGCGHDRGVPVVATGVPRGNP